MKLFCVTIVSILFHLTSSLDNEILIPLKNNLIVKKTLCKLFPKSLAKECDEAEISQSLKISRKKSPKCFICNHLYQLLAHNLDNSKTPNEIQKLLINTCQVFVSPLKDDCISYCQNEGVSMIDKLFKNEDVKSICPIEQDCSQIKKAGPVEINKEKNPVECFLCKQIMKSLEKILDGNSTKEAIINALQRVCWLLPSSKTNQCIDFVEKYAEKIIEFLVDGTTPDVVCHLLLLCSRQDTVPEDTLYFIPRTTIN